MGDCGFCKLLYTENGLFRAANAGSTECPLQFDLIASFDGGQSISLTIFFVGIDRKIRGILGESGAVEKMVTEFNPLIVGVKMG